MHTGDEIFLLLAHFLFSLFKTHNSLGKKVHTGDVKPMITQLQSLFYSINEERCRQVMKCLFSFHSVHFLLTHLQNWHIFTQPVSLSPFFLDTFAKLAPFHFDNFHSVSFSLSQCREVQRLCYLHSANYLLPFITQSFFTQSNSLPMFTQSLFTQPNFLPPYHPANMHPGGGGKM